MLSPAFPYADWGFELLCSNGTRLSPEHYLTLNLALARLSPIPSRETEISNPCTLCTGLRFGFDGLGQDKASGPPCRRCLSGSTVAQHHRTPPTKVRTRFVTWEDCLLLGNKNRCRPGHLGPGDLKKDCECDSQFI